MPLQSPRLTRQHPTRLREDLAGAEIRAASGDGGHGVITALQTQRGSVSRVPKNGVSSVRRGFQFFCPASVRAEPAFATTFAKRPA